MRVRAPRKGVFRYSNWAEIEAERAYEWLCVWTIRRESPREEHAENSLRDNKNEARTVLGRVGELPAM